MGPLDYAITTIDLSCVKAVGGMQKEKRGNTTVFSPAITNP